MWNISQVKQRGKSAFKRNYWKSILVFLLVTGLATTSVTITSQWADTANEVLQERSISDRNYISTTAHPTSYATGWDDDFQFDYGYGNGFEGFDFQNPYDFEEGILASEDPNESNLHRFLEGLTPVQLIFATLFFFLISLAVMIAVDVCITNPLSMGSSRFYLCNLQQPSDVKEICFGFDRNYRNVIKILFFRDLYLVLWYCLFIIPGIVKTYEYRMVPYLLAEHPEMSKAEVFATSKRMMKGEKGKAFLLDLSFIGWIFLSICTFGLLLIFYVGPYILSTSAALYEVLKYSKGTSATEFYRSVPPVTPIQGFGDPNRPSPPPMSTYPSQPQQEPFRQAPDEQPPAKEASTESDWDSWSRKDEIEQPEEKKTLEDNGHMFEDE